MERAASVILLLLAAIVLLNFVQGGPSQVKTWFRAKFLNQAG
jgi:hypothetical protein